ncbi:MAG TPA: site-specific DNA-methyltransferase, partial [Chitinophagales bacterium]|nr:site-specific DNA-methyltransferase [Chitinophagales bacterium]
MNQLILGDNLEILRNMPAETVDLIYLDPPFFSNRNYEVVWGDKGEVRSFEDRFSGGIEHYIAWLKDRVQEMHRILKPTGSIFVHCDWHANAHIRVYILDKIFGGNNFRGEIIWQRTNVHNDAKKKLAVIQDTIWYYSKGEENVYNPIFRPYGEKYLKDFYKYRDENGVYRLGDLTNTRIGGYDYAYKGYLPNQNGWRCPLETMEKLDAEGLIHFPKSKSGRLCIKRYLNPEKGTLIGTIWEDIDWLSLTNEEFDLLFNNEELNSFWSDIQNIQGASSERIGYPTQKPEKLLERIIQMASNEGDLVLDPFMGGGTTIAVADRLKRQWIGIDQSVQAVKVTELRLNNQMNLFSQAFVVALHKYDYDTLRYKDAFEFES